MKSLMFVLIVFCVVAAVYGQKLKQNQDEAKGIAGMLLLSRSYGSTYTAYINGEPVNWSEGGANTLVHGYPLKQGTNRLLVNLVFPSGFWLLKNRVPTADDTYHVFVELELQETDHGSLIVTNWNTVDEWMDSWRANEPFVWEPEFEITNKIRNPQFEPLGTNEATYIDECKAISLKLTKLIRQQDYEQLAKVFELTNQIGAKAGIPDIMIAEHRIPIGSKAILLDSCPALIYRGVKTNEVTVTGISDSSELLAVVGKHLILIHPKNGNHFVSFLNISDKIMLHQWESLSIFDGLKYAGVFNVDCFVFGRTGGKWKFAANGGGWIKNGGGMEASGSGWLDINLSALEKVK